ncbi:MAG: hypothetical protein ACKO96_02790, partial [Flammeovirgaceae bacterium]
MKKAFPIFLIALLFSVGCFAQETFTRNGVKDERSGAFAFTNATIYTNASTKIENAVLLIRNGKISKVGKNLSCSGCRIIDATGKHVTSGIIDEHSHIAVNGGVNEGTEASSAEVRIGDVVQCE